MKCHKLIIIKLAPSPSPSLIAKSAFSWLVKTHGIIVFFYPWSLSFSYTFRSLYQEILLALLPKQIEPNSLWPLPPVHKCLNSYHLSVGQLPWPLAIILHIKGVLRLYHLQFFLTVQKSVQASPKGFREHVNNITALIGRENKIEWFGLLKHEEIYKKSWRLA